MADDVYETFDKVDGMNPDRTYTYELYCNNGKWSVTAWEGDEHMWDVHGVVVGYKDGNPSFPIRDPFTEETARAEFERWRR